MNIKKTFFALSILSTLLTTAEAHYGYKPTNYEISTYDLYAVHYLHIIPRSNIIQLTDGSQWLIDNDCTSSLAYSDWRVNDRIQITQKNSWSLQGGIYRITNLETGEYVTGNIYLSASPESPARHVIAGIDYYTGYIQCRDGLTFTIYDTAKISQWIPGHDIFIGMNAWGWLYDLILINVDRNEYTIAYRNK